MVIVWNPDRLSDDERQFAHQLCRFAAAGGRVVVLSTKKWDWNALCTVSLDRTSGSRVFPSDGADHYLLRGVDRECLKRWNGLPGTVAVGSLRGLEAKTDPTAVLWVREPKHTVVAEVPTADGDGMVLFSQLDLRRHVVPSSSHYDPVAEQILLNMLAP